MEILNGFAILGERLNASQGCETVVAARARLKWVITREKKIAEDKGFIRL